MKISYQISMRLFLTYNNGHFMIVFVHGCYGVIAEIVKVLSLLVRYYLFKCCYWHGVPYGSSSKYRTFSLGMLRCLVFFLVVSWFVVLLISCLFFAEHWRLIALFVASVGVFLAFRAELCQSVLHLHVDVMLRWY